ncbi:MAG: hypothetical protein ACK53Y_12640, partial [bacterium]
MFDHLPKFHHKQYSLSFSSGCQPTYLRQIAQVRITKKPKYPSRWKSADIDYLIKDITRISE